jgi:signal peptidase I
MEEKKRKYRWLSVVFSLFVPGLGLVAAGKVRRGILWFVMLEVPPYLVLYVYKPLIAIIVLISLILGLVMLVDSWRPIEHLTMKRCTFFTILSIIGLLISIFVDPLDGYRIDGYRIDGSSSTGSMYPTINETKGYLLNDRVIWSKTAYRNAEPQRGDIIVILSNAFPILNERNHAKRIAALPHERVRIIPPKLFINGEVITGPVISRANGDKQDRYIHYRIPRKPNYCMPRGLCWPGDVEELGSNEYFILGDNTKTSYDSRYFGPVNRSNIIGKVEAIIWPPHRIRNL